VESPEGIITNWDLCRTAQGDVMGEAFLCQLLNHREQPQMILPSAGLRRSFISMGDCAYVWLLLCTPGAVVWL